MFLIADLPRAAKLRLISALTVAVAGAAVVAVSPADDGDAESARVVVLVGGKRSCRAAGIAPRSALSDRGYSCTLVELPEGADCPRGPLRIGGPGVVELPSRGWAPCFRSYHTDEAFCLDLA